jgi:hypothetical protein
LLSFAGCGLCAGLAYLVRPEGLLVVPAVGLVLLGKQAVKVGRRPWREFAACTSCLVLMAALSAAPLVAITGHLTNKPSSQAVLSVAGLSVSGPGCARPGLPLAVWWTGPAGSHPAFIWGLWALATETAHAFQYLSCALAFLGLWWFRDRVRARPGVLAPIVLSVLLSVILVRMSLLVGYLGERHVLLIIMCGSFWAMAAATALAERLTARGPRWLAVALLAALCGSGLPPLIKPLHATQVGYFTAGRWLATHTNPADEIVDTQGCAYFYAGRVFSEGAEPSPQPDHEPVPYLVVEAAKHAANLPPDLDGRVRDALAHGTLVFHCPVERGKEPEVQVYAVRGGIVVAK